MFPMAADDEKKVGDWERKQFALQGNRHGSDLQSQEWSLCIKIHRTQLPRGHHHSAWPGTQQSHLGLHR